MNLGVFWRGTFGNGQDTEIDGDVVINKITLGGRVSKPLGLSQKYLKLINK